MVFVQHYDSPLGPVTLACDETAIIGLWFDGQKYFGNILPEQLAEKEHPLLQDAKRWLDIYFSGRAPDFTPPLRYDSTPFRKVVCDILLTIPYGKTMTYGEIAAEIAIQQGLEKMSAQAVGGAVGHNPISLIAEVERQNHHHHRIKILRRHVAAQGQRHKRPRQQQRHDRLHLAKPH